MRPSTRAHHGPPHPRPRALAYAVSSALVVTGLVAVGGPAQAAGATYYVDADPTICTDAGAGTSTAPFCSISAAAKAAGFGDTVSVAAGTYPEQVTVPIGGVTYQATGTAVVDGRDSGGIPTRNFGFLVRAVDGVVIDGFTFAGQVKHGIFLDSNTAGVPASNITVRNVRVDDAGDHGINIQKADTVLVSKSTVQRSGRVGIRVFGSTGVTIASGASSNNIAHGISVQGASTGTKVVDMVTTGNRNPATRVSTGIDVSGGSSGTLVERNTSYGNDDSGIEVYSGATGTVVRRNLTYDNGDHGIDMNAVPGTTVVSNTSVGNYTAGLNVENASTDVTLRDNISANDGTAASARTRGNYRVDATSQTGTTLDRDIAYQSSASSLYYWGTTAYSSLATFRNGTKQELHGFAADPKFISLAGRDLHPTVASPAVDAAFTDVPGWSSTDRYGNGPADEPSVPNTGTGSVSYADIGAVEMVNVSSTDAKPVARLTAKPASLTAGGSTTLDASASTDDKGIASYAFSCDNGGAVSTGTAQTKSCTYATAGTYHPSVTVKDTGGHSDTATVTVTVTAPTTDALPVAKLTLSRSTVRQGDRVTADASASTDDIGVAGYQFRCGGQPVQSVRTTPTSTCRFLTRGTYTIRVTVIDTKGQTSDATATLTVIRGIPPTARLTVSDKTPAKRQRIILDASRSTGTAVLPTLTFKFQCGTAPATRWQTSPRKACTFSTIGWKTLKVWVRNAPGLWSVASMRVYVHRR